MSAIPPNLSQSHSRLISWLLAGWARLLAASRWLVGVSVKAPKRLTRSQEKERRKAIIAKHNS